MGSSRLTWRLTQLFFMMVVSEKKKPSYMPDYVKWLSLTTLASQTCYFNMTGSYIRLVVHVY